MGVRYERFVRSSLTPEEVSEVEGVDRIAGLLRAHLESEEARVDIAHVHGAQSSVIQAILGELLLRSGFDTEVVLTPDDGFVRRARPDFVFRLGPKRGILAEVEGGERSTTTTTSRTSGRPTSPRTPSTCSSLFPTATSARTAPRGRSRSSGSSTVPRASSATPAGRSIW